MERSKPPFSTPKVWLDSWERRRHSPILLGLFWFTWSEQFAVEVRSSDCQINCRCKWRLTCNFELSPVDLWADALGDPGHHFARFLYVCDCG